MITVAVTGGIGSGKSTVSAALVERGAVLIDSDLLAREVVAPGTEGLAAVAAAFGQHLIGADGALDRAALAAVVFSDSAARRTLEGITHPRVRARFAELQAAAAPDAVVVNDIPILTTLPVAAGFHLVIGVQASAQVRVQRLILRGLSEADAKARMAAQLGDDERAALCDVVLSNNGDRSELGAQVAALWHDRLVPFEANTRAGRAAPRTGPRLTEYQASWVADGVRLAARASSAAGGARVDHIGSTAIPGMPAKDVIDLQLTVPSLQAADELAGRLGAAGFPAHPGFDQDEPHPVGDDPDLWRKRMHVNADPGQSINLHLRVKDGPGWRWALLFRDWLRADSAVAAEYLELKRSVARAHAGDVSTAGYAEAKEPWMAAVYPRGLAWAERTGWTAGQVSTAWGVQ
jgi:dephospho-CoA kinase